MNATSLPYVINFDACKPESSVTLTLYAHTTASDCNTNGTFDNLNFTLNGAVSRDITVSFGGT